MFFSSWYTLVTLLRRQGRQSVLSYRDHHFLGNSHAIKKGKETGVSTIVWVYFRANPRGTVLAPDTRLATLILSWKVFTVL